jgi:hypothetical protein
MPPGLIGGERRNRDDESEIKSNQDAYVRVRTLSTFEAEYVDVM